MFGQIVFATAANQKLATLDTTTASSMPGVHRIIVAGDVPASGMNSVNGAIPGNEQEKVFYNVGDVVPNVGAPVALVVADTWAQARRAAKQVVQTFQSVGGGNGGGGVGGGGGGGGGGGIQKQYTLSH